MQTLYYANCHMKYTHSQQKEGKKLHVKPKIISAVLINYSYSHFAYTLYGKDWENTKRTAQPEWEPKKYTHATDIKIKNNSRIDYYSKWTNKLYKTDIFIAFWTFVVVIVVAAAFPHHILLFIWLLDAIESNQNSNEKNVNTFHRMNSLICSISAAK